MAKLRIINPHTGFDSKNEKEKEYEGIGKAYRPTDAVQKKKEIEMLSSAAGNGKTRFQNFVASTQADMQRRKEQQEQEAREMAAEMLTAPAERFQYTAGAEYLAMKKQQEEKQKRVQYAEDLSKNYGYKNIAGKAVYVTPFSPLPKPTKENTASRAQAPGAYGIAPKQFLDAMTAIDRYTENAPPEAKSEPSPRATAFVDEWFGGSVPTAQEVLEKWKTLDEAERQRLWTEFENVGPELNDLGAYQDLLEQYEAQNAEEKAAYDDALKLLGVDAEQYAGGTTADYLGRYGQTYGVERNADAYKDSYKVPGVFGNYDEHDATMHSIMNRGKENEYSGTSLETGRTLLQQKMTDEQANTYMALAEQYGEGVAQEYFQSLLSDGANGEDSYNKQAYGIREAALLNEARANWLKATGKSFLNVPGQLAGTMYSIEQGLKGEEIDPYDTAFMPGQAVQTPRSEVNDMITRNFGTVDKAGEYHDNLWSWLMKAGYNAATSGGDSALSGILTLGIPGAGAAMQGAWSMGGTVQDATIRQGNTGQALLLGGINALIETATEYLPMDHLIKTIESKDIKTFGQLIKNAFFGGLKEAPGEGLSTLGSYVSDDLIMGKMSNWDALVKEKGVFGAARQVAGEVLTDAFVGFLSGESSNMIGGVTPLLTNNMNGTQQADNASADQQAEPIPELVEAAHNQVEQEYAKQGTDEQAAPVEDEYQPDANEQDAHVQEAHETEAQEVAEDVEEPSVSERKGAENKPSSVPKNGKNAHALNKNLTAAVINNGGVNEVVRVSGIDRVADGTVYVSVTDQAGNERVESSENLDFAGDVNELLGSSDVKQLDEGSMAAYLNGYDSSLATPPVYMRAYMGVYNRARSGLDYMQSVVMSEAAQRALTTEAANEAYMAGMSQYNTENGVQVGMTRRMQEAVIDKLNKLTGGKIRLVDSDLGGANARYDKKTGVIEISTKAEKGAYAYYAMHETVHKLKNENQQAWGKFQTLMEDTLLTHDVDIDAEMARVTELYKKQGQNLTPDEALEEVICNSAPAILQDAEIVKEMFAKDRTTMEKVTDFLRDVLDKMTSVLKGLGDDMGELGSWKGMQALKDDHESLKAIYDCLMEGLEGMNQQAQQEDVSDTNVVKMSAKEQNFVEDKYFARQMDHISDLKQGGYTVVGKITEGSPLNMVGITAGTLYFDNSKIISEAEKHGDHLDGDVFKQIPAMLSNPIAISQPKVKNTVSVYGEMEYNGSPIVVGVMIAKNNMGTASVAKIRTIHARRDVSNQITDDSVLYLNPNKKETEAWFQARDIVVPLGGTRFGFIRSIELSGDFVNKKLSLPEDIEKSLPVEENGFKYSLREEEPPKKTIKGYKVFAVFPNKPGELYPPMVANPGGAATPVGVWLNADAAPRAEDSKTGRPKVQAGGKGTQASKQTLAYRPGWHLGDAPRASQFVRLNPETGKKELFPENFVWAECDVAADLDYQEEAMSYGYNANGKFQHSLAGLPRLPREEDGTAGYYRYRTNPNPDTVPWIISGAIKVNRILDDEETRAVLNAQKEEFMDSDEYAAMSANEKEKALERFAYIPRKGGDIDLEAFGLHAGDTTGDMKFSLREDSAGNSLTEEQQKYFADSKVRDENGRLLVMYHGTPNGGFNEFSYGRIGSTTDYGYLGRGFYFTSKPNVAKYYAGYLNSSEVKEGYVNITNPYIIPSKNDLKFTIESIIGRRFDGYDADYERSEAFTDWLKDNGYDGVICKDEYMALYPNQFKNLDNASPTIDPDIRYSLRETDETVQDSLSASEKLFTMTHGHLMSDKDAKWMADKVKAIAQSKIDTTELMNELKRIYSYAERGENVSMEQMDSERIALAEKVMAESKTLDTVHEERVKPIRDYLRTTRISLTDEQRKEAASLTGNIGAYRRMMFGRVRLTQDGTPLDTVWSELTDLDSKLFPADAGEAEMASLLLDAVDAIAPIYQNNSGMNAMEAAQWLAMEMDNKYFALGGVQKTVKEQNKLDISLRQYRDVMDRFQKEHKVVFDEKMAKVKASMDEEKAKVLQQAENQRRLDKLEAEADARAYANEQIADVKAKSAAEMEAYREAMRAKDKEFRETYREKAKETSRKQRYREQIVRMENELVKRLEKPTDKKHIMAGLDEAVLEFVTSLNLGGKNKRTRDLGTRIHQLKDAMGEAQKDADKNYLIDPDLLVDMDTLAKEVKGLGNLNELTADQMRDMRDMVKAVTHIVNTADQMFTMKKRVTTGQVAQNFMDEASRKKDKKKREGFMGMVDEMVNEGMLDSFRFFDRLGTSARELFQSLRNGFDEKVRCVAQANDYVQEQAKNLDKDIVKGKKAKKTTFQLSGGTIELTKAQVMELYCLNKRNQAKMHLYNGGIRTEDAVSAVKVNEADVQKIIDSLSAAECRVADALQLFMAKNCAEWGNQTSMTLYGYSKFGEKNYYPITVDKNTTQTMQTEAGQDENLYAILNMGMTKSLNEKATNALMIGDIFDTFSRHVDNMSTYRAYAAPIADMLRWYNWKSMDGQSVKTMLERKYGAKGRDYISLLIRDINGQNKANYSPGFMEKATQKAKSASVGANLRVAIQQPTAIARAADMMSPKYIAAGLTMSKKQMGRAIQLAQEYCPIAKWKSMGFYETHIGKGLRDMMFGGQGTLQTVSDHSMWLAGKMDEVTWGALWRACEKETRALYPDLKGEALYEETGKRLGQIIDYTQVVDTPLHRSQMMRSKNYGVQMATAFMSEPSKTYNMLYSAISRFAENRRDPVAKAKLARCITTYAATALLNALAQSVMDAVRDDDENETFAEKYLDALGGNAADNLNPLGMLPYAKDILSMMQGYDPSRMDMQAIEKFVQIATELRKVVTGEDSKWSVHKWIRSTASALSYATGVPLENAMRDLTSIANTFSMQFGGKPLPMQHETATTSYAYENMYDALMSGDKTTWNRIDGKLKADEESPKSNSTIDTGIGKLLSEEDERIAQAWEAKVAGKASEVNRIRKEIVNELAETGVLDKERLNEIVDKAITTYGNAVTPKEEKGVDTEKQLKVKMYTQADASKALRDMADGKVSEADVKAILSEVVADSEAKDPEKSVRSNVISDVKKDWLAAAKSSDTRKANSLSSAMKSVLGVTKAEMDKWLTDSYADDLRTAVDAYSTGNAKNVIAKLRARGLDDYDIKDKLSKYRQMYIDAMKRGDRTTANRIKSTLMSLGLKYKSGDPMYTDSTFSGWMK